MRVVWTGPAEDDFTQQIVFVKERHQAAARRLATSVFDRVDILALYPMSGRAGRVEGTREAPVGTTKLIVVYAVETDRLIILRILHGAQKWP